MNPRSNYHRNLNIRRYLVSGVLTVIPLWITWVVFDWVLRLLSRLGTPWVRALSRQLEESTPTIAAWLLTPVFRNVLAVCLTLLGLYVLGWAANRVIGQRVIRALESALASVPFVQTVYGGVKKLVAALQREPAGIERVVLISFPSPQMRTVGLVTQTMLDATTGRELAAVYVPTTPNPTSGYVEIVPVEDLVPTSWTIDEAMTFVISGGAVSPGEIHYENVAARSRSDAAQTTSAE